MIELFRLISLPPIKRAFFAFIIAGGAFPLVGSFIVVMNLVPLRFALMHGALLGGVIGLLLNMNNLLFPILICFLIVGLLGPFSNKFNIGLSNSSAFFMITSIAVAFIIIDKFNIPSMEAFSIFWGNIYALSNLDLILLVILAFAIVVFILTGYNKITALLYDTEIAYTSGLNSNLFYYLILSITGIVVALSIKIIGALLVDCLLLLPAMAGLYFARSIKGLFIKSSVIGLISAVIGFISSLLFKIQASPSVTIVCVLIILILYFINKIRRRIEK